MVRTIIKVELRISSLLKKKSISNKGQEVASRLRSVMSPKTVKTHLQDDTTESLHESLEMFRTSDDPAVLVCDKSGEEEMGQDRF